MGRRAVSVIVAALLAATSGCGRPDEEARRRVRSNLGLIDDYLWRDVIESNQATFEHGPLEKPPIEIGRHAAGAFVTPVRPTGALEVRLVGADGLMHEQYDIDCDRVGFKTWGGIQPTRSGDLGAAIWRPRWITIEARAASGPRGAVECTRRSVAWEDIGRAAGATQTVLLEISEERTIHPQLVRHDGPCIDR